ncbi:MAG: hypothetical protein Q4F78_06685 [Bacillota bacterium]|nr:hypothetical protein [Bacillota bacterium]
MKITIKTDKTNLSIPMPLGMAAMAIKKVPDSVLDKFRAKVPPAYAKAICKENLIFLFEECRPELEKFKGLELINARKDDGTYISIVL